MSEVPVVYVDNTDVNTIIKSVGIKQKRTGKYRINYIQKYLSPLLR